MLRLLRPPTVKRQAGVRGRVPAAVVLAAGALIVVVGQAATAASPRQPVTITGLRWAQNGAVVGFDGSFDGSGQPRPFVADVAAGGMRALSAADGPFAIPPSPLLSPDGHWRAIGSRAGVVLTPAAGGQELLLRGQESIAWLPSGELLTLAELRWRSGALALQSYRLEAVKPATGQERVVVDDADIAGAPAVVSPDGTRVAFTQYVGAGPDGAVLFVASTAARSSGVLRLTPTVCRLVPLDPVTQAGWLCLEGGNRGSTFVGGPNRDLILAGPGADAIRTGEGNDFVAAAWGADVIDTGDGDDNVDAGAGDDRITLGNGRDTADAGPGRDVVFAGDGDDTVVLVDGERDTVVCGPGRDIVRVDSLDRVADDCEIVRTYKPAR